MGFIYDRHIKRTDSRALKNEGRAECAATNDDLLASSVYLGNVLSGTEWLGGDSLHTYCTTTFEDNLLDLRVDYKVEVLVHGSS